MNMILMPSLSSNTSLSTTSLAWILLHRDAFLVFVNLLSLPSVSLMFLFSSPPHLLLLGCVPMCWVSLKTYPLCPAFNSKPFLGTLQLVFLLQPLVLHPYKPLISNHQFKSIFSNQFFMSSSLCTSLFPFISCPKNFGSRLISILIFVICFLCILTVYLVWMSAIAIAGQNHKKLFSGVFIMNLSLIDFCVL